MAASPHYKELLLILNEHEVEYLIVGGYAVMKYTEPRYTKDLDLWVRNSPENSKRLYHALTKFGAPLKHDGITPETFTNEEIVYQIGVAQVRVDLSTHIDGVEFDAAWKNRGFRARPSAYPCSSCLCAISSPTRKPPGAPLISRI